VALFFAECRFEIVQGRHEVAQATVRHRGHRLTRSGRTA
jgi:hypothetical protein